MNLEFLIQIYEKIPLKICRQCGTNLPNQIKYYESTSGWKIEDKIYWLSIKCPGCGYDHSLWKLGYGRDAEETKNMEERVKIWQKNAEELVLRKQAKIIREYYQRIAHYTKEECEFYYGDAVRNGLKDVKDDPHKEQIYLAFEDRLKELGVEI